MLRALLFGLARIFGHEPSFQKYTVSDAALRDALAGKRVAIVGNSRALAKTAFGAEIDTCDLIIRINRAPMPDPVSHGRRTHWLALATSLSRPEYSRIAPTRVLWMSHKRKRLPFWLTQGPGFYLHPLRQWETLGARLGHPPSTGAMLIDLVARSRAGSIDLFGFDFFASKSLSGRRDATQVPHDFSAEKDFVLALADKDRRITIHN